MDGLDAATWQALGLVLTLLGLGVSGLVWARRGPAPGLRGVAWSLLPLAAGLTGTLRLVGDVVGAFSRWSSRLVLDPLTWTGIAVAGASAVLFLVSGRLLRRDPTSRASRRAVRADRGRGGATDDPLSAPGTGRPGLGRRASAPPARPASPSGSAAPAPGTAGDPDLDEIEAILRRRGIT